MASSSMRSFVHLFIIFTAFTSHRKAIKKSIKKANQKVIEKAI